MKRFNVLTWVAAAVVLSVLLSVGAYGDRPMPKPKPDDPTTLDGVIAKVKEMQKKGRPRAEIAQWLSQVLDRRISNVNWGGADAAPLSSAQKDAWNRFGFDDTLTYEQIAQEAWKHRVGQCQEHTLVAYYILKKAGVGGNIRIVQGSKDDSTHAFLVWGVPPGDPTDPRTWGPVAISVDGWLGYSLRKDSAWKHRYYSYEGTRELQDKTEEWDSSAETKKAKDVDLSGDWRDNGGNEYRVTKQGDKYTGKYLKVNDRLKSCHFTVGEEGFRNFTPVPGKANTFEGEAKWRSSDQNDKNYPQWRKSVITLNGDSLTITECTYPQWMRIKR